MVSMVAWWWEGASEWTVPLDFQLLPDSLEVFTLVKTFPPLQRTLSWHHVTVDGSAAGVSGLVRVHGLFSLPDLLCTFRPQPINVIALRKFTAFLPPSLFVCFGFLFFKTRFLNISVSTRHGRRLCLFASVGQHF